MFKHALAALAAALLAALAPAEEYTLKFKSYPAEGEVVQVKFSEKSSEASKLEVNGKVESEEAKKEVKENEYALKVTKRGEGKRPAEFTRTYTTANKGPEGKAEKLPFAGRTILFTLKDDKYVPKATGTPDLDDKQLKDVNTTYSSADPLLDPGKPVKVGDSWSPDNKALVEFFGKDAGGDVSKARATVKLLKVYQRTGGSGAVST